nr:DUF3120 domain-containing protein [Microcoleus sp. FACHB-SPT15]
MFNNTWFSSSASGFSDQSEQIFLPGDAATLIGNRQAWLMFAAASFLVSVPVFVQAPLVRQLPLLSLVMTLLWVGLGLRLLKRTETKIWGDLLLGFSWSWLAGSIYWGWLRWEPLIHLPVEAIGLPFAVWGLWRGWGMVGNLFYLGSLFGTALTDVYFYLTDLIPHWRQVMQVDPALATPIFQSAIAQVQTPWGISWAVVLIGTLLVVGLWSLGKGQLQWWAFSGAVLSTILVDSLFWVAASLA